MLGERTLIMGVLNVTPDSFTDGGKFSDPDRAYAHAIELEEAGADIIDVGAESTRPGSQRISEAEELRRLIPVLKRMKNKLSVPLSVDTTSRRSRRKPWNMASRSSTTLPASPSIRNWREPPPITMPA